MDRVITELQQEQADPSTGHAPPGPNRRRKRRKKPPRPSAFPTLSQQEWDAIEEALDLTLRQLQVVQGKFEEHTHAEIAKAIGRTEAAAEKHWRVAMDKADVDSLPKMMHKIYAIIMTMRIEEAKKAALATIPGPAPGCAPQADPPQEPSPPTQDAPVSPTPVPENRRLPPAL